MADADPEPLTDEAAAAIIWVLQEHGVQFIVIGGFAIQLHQVDGLPRTSDIDVTPERSRDNLQRLADALTDLDARLRGDRLPDEGLPVPWHVDLLDRVDTALNLITKFGPLDLSLKPSGTDGYHDLNTSAVEFALSGVMVPTASLADVIRSKTAAGRRQGQPRFADPPAPPTPSDPVTDPCHSCAISEGKRRSTADNEGHRRSSDQHRRERKLMRAPDQSASQALSTGVRFPSPAPIHFHE